MAEREIAKMHSPNLNALSMVALAHAYAGETELAMAEVRESLDREIKLVGEDDAVVSVNGSVQYVLGDLEAAEIGFRRNSDAFARAGETGARSTMEGDLALARFDLGRPDEEVITAAETCRTLAARDDVASQILWREATALVAARNRRFDEARTLIGEALELADRTDFPYQRGLTERDKGWIEEMAGDLGAARSAYARALGFFDGKGDVVDAQRMREALARVS
jgi:Flp pilus assembly protein TadD